MKITSRFGYRKLFLAALLLPPIFVSLQTIERFLLWETTTGKFTKTIGSSSSFRGTRYFEVEFFIGKEIYTVRSSIGTSASTPSFSDKSKVGVLYNLSDPSKATIKYRYGQLYKLFFFYAVFGVFWVVSRLSFKGFDANDAKDKRMRDALPLNLLDKKPEFCQMIEAGEKIEAIQYLRDKYLLSLKDAKAEVEKYL